MTPGAQRLHGTSLVPAMHRGDEPRRVHVAAAFSQWPMGVGVRPSASHCMGYAVRVVNWTMVQWVRAGHSSLASGMVGAPIVAAAPPGPGMKLETCERHAELYRTPWRGGAGTPRAEAVNVLRRYPQVARRLRMRLMRTMGLRPALAGIDSPPAPALRRKSHLSS